MRLVRVKQALDLQDEDEEARYSAVDRGTSASVLYSEPSTAASCSRENGKKAWTSAAGSVAAVSGR